MTPITKDALTKALAEALADRTPDNNVTGWMKKLADDLGYGRKSVEGWCYGHYPPEPEKVFTLMAHLGPTFANKVLVLAGLVSAHVDDAELIVSANAIKDIAKLSNVLRAAADEIDEHAGKLQPREAA